jgi:1-aminocyclopropane-1-carboxylate deaminase
MLLSIIDLVEKDYFPKGSSILAINTGGLQGNKGINKKFGVELPINYN